MPSLVLMPVIALSLIIAGAILPDICDLDELQTGQRREGRFTSVMAFVAKIEISLAVVLVGYVVSCSGVDTNIALRWQEAAAEKPGPAAIFTAGERAVFSTADDLAGPYHLLTPGGLGQGLWQPRSISQTGTLLGGDDFQKIRGPHSAGNPDWMIGGIEGPFGIKRPGVYWMFFSAWTRGYEFGVLRAESPLGPWELTLESPIFGARKRRHRETQAREGGNEHLVYEDTADPFVEVGHNAVFEGPDWKDWLCCHYFPGGREIMPTDPLLPDAGSHEQLGREPLHYSDGCWRVNGPTWTEQTVRW